MVIVYIFSSVYSKIVSEREMFKIVVETWMKRFGPVGSFFWLNGVDSWLFYSFFFNRLCFSLQETQLILHIEIASTMSNVNLQNNLNESLSLNFLHVLLVEASNYLGSTFNILVFSRPIMCTGWSMLMCRETWDVVVPGLLCSENLAFKDLSVSPIYEASHVYVTSSFGF